MYNHQKSMKQILPLLAAVFSFTFQGSATVLPAEKLLPDDTLVLFSIPDFAKAREAYNKSPQGQLWRDPSFQPFKDKFVNKFKQEYISPLERDLSIHIDDYTSLPQGQFTLAVTQNGWNAKDKSGPLPGLLLLLDTKDKSSQLKTNLADLKKKWVDAGKSVRTEKIRDVEFSIITISSNDLPKTLKTAADSSESKDDADAKAPATKKEIYVGQAESLLILGNSSKTIEKVLASMSGGSVKTIGDVPAYAANQNALFRDASSFGWVNAKALVDTFSHLDDDSDSNSGGPFSFKMDKVLTALGLKGLSSLALSSRFSDEGGQANLFIGVPESSRVGIFKILAGEPKEYAPPAFVPADALKFHRWRMDGQKAWAVLQQMVGDISPPALSLVKAQLSAAETEAKDKNPDFDINKNLFGNLGDDIISYSKAPKGDSLADLNSAPSLFLLGSPNAEQLAGALKNIMALVGQDAGSLKEREFLGHKIYTLPLPATAPKGTKAEPRTLSYACSGGYIAFSSDPAMLEEYLRSSQAQGKSLRETPGLGDATQKVAGSGTSLFAYSNDSENIRTTLAALKKDLGSDDVTGALGPIAAAMGKQGKIKDWFDFSLLPPAESLAKYFSFTVYGGGATADGLMLKTFSPVPPQLKK
jgi:hypothetical protein